MKNNSSMYLFMLLHVFKMLKSVCMCLLYGCMSVIMDTCTHMKIQRRSSSVFLCGSLPISLRQRLSLNLQLADLAKHG